MIKLYAIFGIFVAIFPFYALSQNAKGYELKIDVDDIWEIPENTPIGREVKTIKVVQKSKKLEYRYSLNVDGPNSDRFKKAFKVDVETGVVKLENSLAGEVSLINSPLKRKSFSNYSLSLSNRQIQHFWLPLKLMILEN